MVRSFLLCAALHAALVFGAPFRFAQIFAPNAVLQQGQPLNIWGWSTPSTYITVSITNYFLSNLTVYGNGTSDADGLWVVTLPPQPPADGWILWAGVGEQDPRCRTFAYYCTAPAAVVSPIATGDVILCIGQSNMQVNVGFVFNASYEVAAAGLLASSISYTQVEASVTAPSGPLDDFAVAPSIPWTTASAATISGFSATCWFSAKSLVAARSGTHNDIRLGLISAPWGGTSIKVHAPLAVNTSCGALYPGGDAGCGEDHAPCQAATLYNSMQAPIHGPRGFPVSTMIWFQGENDALPSPSSFSWYSCMLQGLVPALRSVYASPQSTWVTLQLAPYSGGAVLAPFRKMQCDATALIPNASCVVLADDGDITSPIGTVHSRNKQLVGRRVGAVLASSLYGVPLPTRGGAGPTFQSAQFIGAGGTSTLSAIVSFDVATLGPRGLIPTPPSTSPWSNATRCATDNGLIKVSGCGWFNILGSDGVAYNTTAVLFNNSAVAITAQGVPISTRPIGVAWGWNEWPVNEFANEFGYPLVPFYYNATA